MNVNSNPHLVRRHCPLLWLVLLALFGTAWGEPRADAFDRMDTNSDGRLSRQELPRPWLFSQADADADGFVSRVEAGDLLRRWSSRGETGTPMRRSLDVLYANVPGVDPNLLSLDLYMPVSIGKYPVVVMIHGGGWRTGDKRSPGVAADKADYFVGQGYVFVSINYRLSPAVQHPVHVEDVATALAWLSDHLAEYGGDPERMFVMGHSAGAHLAALVATDARRLKAVGKDLDIIRGVVPLDSEALDLPRHQGEFRLGRGLSDVYTQAFGPSGPGWRDASPQYHVSAGKGIPPFLILHTERRESVGEISRDFAKALTAAGSPSQAIGYPGKTHATLNREIGQPGDGPTAAITEFLQERLAALDVSPVSLVVDGGATAPVIGPDHPGLAGNKHGFEGGRALRANGAYHLFTAEMYDEPFWVSMRLAHWTSDDLHTWRRVGTIFQSKGAGHEKDPKFSIWSPMPIYNAEEGRWNLFYIAYRGPLAPGEGTHMEGKVYRAVSTVPGEAGLDGPYEDAGVVLRPDAQSQAWEGQQGTDSFCPWRVRDRWYSFYGSHDYEPIGPWPVGLATAPALAGPWVRCEGNPSPIEAKFIENPIVSNVGDAYVAVYDSGEIEGPATYVVEPRHVGYAVSGDGTTWPPGKRLPVLPEGEGNWSEDLRTPLGLIPMDDGRHAMLYTAKLKGEMFWSVGLAYVEVTRGENPDHADD